MDATAFESMIRKNHMVLIASSCPPCDPDDLVQMALVEIFRQWGKFNASKSNRTTWAMMVARYAILGERKREAKHHGDMPEFIAKVTLDPMPDDEAESFEITLPDGQAEILALAVNTPMTVEEIATETGRCPQGVRRIMAVVAGKIERRAVHG